MYIDPRHLAQLSMIVETGSFQAAAHRLRLTQPALSRNIKVLEDRIGSAVFDRSSRQAKPTSLGLKLAQNGLAVRNAEEDACHYSELVSKGLSGEIRIGTPPIIAGRFLTQHIAKFLAGKKDCKIDLKVGLVHTLRTMLERAQIDLVIGPQELAENVAKSEFIPLIDDRVGVLCRNGHPLLAKNKITPEDIEQQSWVSHSRNSMLRRQTDAALVAMGLRKINTVVETDSIQSVLEIVASTDMISTMPRQTTKPYLSQTLVFLEIDHAQFHRPIGAIFTKTASEKRLVREFLDLLISSYPSFDNNKQLK